MKCLRLLMANKNYKHIKKVQIKVQAFSADKVMILLLQPDVLHVQQLLLQQRLSLEMLEIQELFLQKTSKVK